jgi:hypothetical protein
MPRTCAASPGEDCMAMRVGVLPTGDRDMWCHLLMEMRRVLGRADSLTRQARQCEGGGEPLAIVNDSVDVGPGPDARQPPPAPPVPGAVST